MKRHHHISVIVAAACLLSCGHSAHWETLAGVESYIEGRPDSALAVLGQIDPRGLSGREERAKHALLLSRALDKNYIDTTSFDVLRPALDYYAAHGSPTEKLRTRYYEGRIYQNRGNEALAMECFVNGLTEGAASDDALTKARVCFAQGKIYYSLFDWDNFIKCNENAGRLFKESGLANSYANCLIRIINGYTLKGDTANALRRIEECRRISEELAPARKADFLSACLSYLAAYGSAREITDAIREYVATVPAQAVDWLAVANAYAKAGAYESALEALSRHERVPDAAKERKFHAVASDVHKNLGDYAKALDEYEAYMALSDSIDYAAYTQDTKFVEERHSLEMQAMREKEWRNRILSWATLSIALLLSVIFWIRSRLKVGRMEKALAEEEAERYRAMYGQMEEERDNLTALLARNDGLGPDARASVGRRLELLNRFFAAYITGGDIDGETRGEIERLLADKDAFMASTRLAFAGSHPGFIRHLEEKGLDEHDTNVGLYIRKLVKNFDN